MVREKRKQREQKKNTTKGFSAFCVLRVFRGQITCLISVFICGQYPSPFFISSAGARQASMLAQSRWAYLNAAATAPVTG